MFGKSAPLERESFRLRSSRTRNRSRRRCEGSLLHKNSRHHIRDRFEAGWRRRPKGSVLSRFRMVRMAMLLVAVMISEKVFRTIVAYPKAFR